MSDLLSNIENNSRPQVTSEDIMGQLELLTEGANQLIVRLNEHNSVLAEWVPKLQLLEFMFQYIHQNDPKFKLKLDELVTQIEARQQLAAKEATSNDTSTPSN